MKTISKTPLEAWVENRIKPFADFESYRLSKLKETIAYAKARSPFYCRQLAEFESEHINSIQDFEQLPFTTVHDIVDNPFGFLSVSQDEVKRIVTLNTSGTTGPGKRIFFTKEDLESIIDYFQHGMSTLVRCGDNVLILLPWQRPGSVGDLLIKALGQMGIRVTPYGPIDDFYNVATIIAKQNIASLVGIPTQVLGLAKYMENRGQGYSSPLRTMLLTTDYVSPSTVKYVEKALDCQVFNHYGMTEMGLGGAVDCEAHQGYHLRHVDLYFEIVNPATGQVVPDGTMGEIVFTTLTRRGMPLIRYATGDLAYFIPEPCPCGTYLKRMSIVRDRKEGQVLLPGEQILSMSQLDDILFSFPLIVDFNALINKNHGQVNLEIRLLVLNHVSEESLQEAKRAILTRFPGISQLWFGVQVSDAVWRPRKRKIILLPPQ